MRKSIYKLFLVVVILTAAIQSCDDPHADHYEVERIVEAERPLDIIKSSSNFSEFAGLLSSTGLERLLDNEGIYTVFAPVNGSIGDLSGFTGEELEAIVKFHISTAVLYSNDIGSVTQLKSLDGKQLFFNRNGAGTVENATINEPDRVARFGVVHGINGVLVPQKNLLEVIFESTEFQYIGDFLKANTDTVFDQSASIAIGFDSLGRTVYDSAFKLVNPVLDNAGLQLSSEDQGYTLFLLSDEYLNEFIGELINTFNIPDPDTTSIINGAISTMVEGSFHAIYTDGNLPGSLSNTSRNIVFTGDLELEFADLASNGAIYSQSGVLFPVEFRFDLTLDQPEFADAQPANREFVDLSTLNRISSNNLTALQYRSGLGGLGFGGGDSWFIQPITEGDYIDFEMGPVIPGTYELDLQSWNASSDINIYFNGELVVANFPLNARSLRVGIGTATVTEPTGNVIRVEAITTSRAFLDYFNFRPVN